MAVKMCGRGHLGADCNERDKVDTIGESIADDLGRPKSDRVHPNAYLKRHY